ncbi:DUF3667 domain-containing protein [Hymenobacter sp. J193]|uniref:DUF3667 domain-containing protein n=1 Tax=Hymenobacter sp. J193 TaxID=2898429 RepID=UPI00215128B3|nr:DUF3667 domain-containing protein [Hymenobacter sp. J193]MCR5886229.1 DUF3667 domain-containing protein [Hymenobacter sp. J193]MCR5890258.1 DUF3667 domain-containing protein [Hymenobacter sp. J193]
MAHSAHKLPSCANCGHDFKAAENYCPDCGQQNHPLDLSFGHVAEEVLEGLFHFDGKVFRTLRQLLFKPGALTRHFWEGKRVAYVPPVRLYVFISFVFFLLLSVAMHAPEHGEARTMGQRIRQASIQFRADSIRLAGKLSTADSAQVKRVLRNSQHVSVLNGIVNTDVNSDTLDYRRWNGVLYTPQEWRELPEYSSAQLDALLRRHGQEPSAWARFAARQGRQIMQSSEQDISHQFVRGISLMMFVLMPVFALLLKLLYVRRKQYYLAHLMFAIHVHCFAFLLFSLTMALSLFAHLPSEIVLVVLPLLALYLALALHRTYQQNWLKTAVKFVFLLGLYTLIIGAGLVGALGLSMVLV